MVLLGEIRVSHRHTFLRRDTINQRPKMVLTHGDRGADLLSLDCPAVAMRLDDVMKAKSPQVLV